MKLYQINLEANYGSTGKIAEALGKMVIEDGGEAYLAHGRKHKPSQLHTFKVGNKLSYAWHLLLTRILDMHGLGSYFSTKKLVKHIAKVKPTIIHLHNIHGYYIHYPTLFDYLKKTKIPIVWTLHDCWAFTGHCSHFENIGCTKWESHCNGCPQKKVYPSSILADRSFKNFRDKKRHFLNLEKTTIVTVSDWLNSTVTRSFLSPHDIKTIHNGVDIKTFKPVENTERLRKSYGLKNERVILGVASVWSKNKGLDDFIELSKHLTENEKIVLIGLNDEQLESLPKNILGIKRTSDIHELAKWYSLASVYVNTSVEESFGMTSAESMACGTPIVVYNATACPELVTKDVGYVVAKNNISELLSAINNILDNTTIDYMSTCRMRVEQHFNIYSQRMEYFNLYKNLSE